MNVAIVAIAEDGLEVDVVLGANVRKTHKVAGGDSVELAVAGGQTLVVRQSAEVAPTAETAAEAEGDLPTGVDVDETADVVETAVGTSEPSVAAVAEVDLRDAEAPRVSEDAAGNTLVPGVDVFPEDGQSVPPLDGTDADGQLNPPAAEVDEDQADLFGGANPFETSGEVEAKE